MTNDTTTPELLTFKDVAKVLGCSDRTVWTLIDSGRLRSVRFGRLVRIDRADLAAFIEAAKAGGVEERT